MTDRLDTPDFDDDDLPISDDRNPYFGDIVDACLNRRGALMGLLAVGAVGAAATVPVGREALAASASTVASPACRPGSTRPTT